MQLSRPPGLLAFSLAFIPKNNFLAVSFYLAQCEPAWEGGKGSDDRVFVSFMILRRVYARH